MSEITPDLSRLSVEAAVRARRQTAAEVFLRKNNLWLATLFTDKSVSADESNHPHRHDPGLADAPPIPHLWEAPAAKRPCERIPEELLRAQVRWIGEDFTGRLPPTADTFALAYDIALFADEAAPKILEAYRGQTRPYDTGILPNPYDLYMLEYGLSRPPDVSLGSIVLESPAGDEQDAA